VPDKRFRDYNPKQLMALPPALDDWLPRDHLVYFISEVVDQFDLSAVMDSYQERRGQPPYHPVMLVKVWLYACCQGISSSRKLEKALVEDVGFRVLATNQSPDHWTLSEFRRRHHKALGDLLVESVRVASRAGMYSLGHVSIDGTKLKASASKGKSLRYDQLSAIEKRLSDEVREFLERTEANDAAEDAKYGQDSGWRLPPELDSRQKRLEAIRRAKEQIEEEARRQHRVYQDRAKKRAKRAGRDYKPQKPLEEVRPKDKAQTNLTDPDSKLMNSTEGFIQGYNAQVVVDSNSQVILAADAAGLADDSPFLPVLLQQVIANTGCVPEELAADTGYWSLSNLSVLSELGIEPYIAPIRARKLHGEHHQMSTVQSENGIATNRMIEKLRTEHGRERYALRMSSVEPVFGHIKEAMQFRRVRLRGAPKVRSLWRLQCAAFNLLKVYRHALAAGYRSAVGVTG